MDIGAYEAQQIALDPATLRIGPWGVPYSHTFAARKTATSRRRGPFTFAVTAGTPPAGLSLSADGVLSGTPMPSQTGTFTFTVTASNGAGFGSQQYTLTINPPPPIHLTPLRWRAGTAGSLQPDLHRHAGRLSAVLGVVQPTVTAWVSPHRPEPVYRRGAEWLSHRGGNVHVHGYGQQPLGIRQP